LETEEIFFRGPFRLRIPLREIRSVHAEDGELIVETASGQTTFRLGSVAEKWAEKIRNPRTLLDKLGVKPGMTVSVIDLEDADFLTQLGAKTDRISVGAPTPASDIIFLGLQTRADLERIPDLKRFLKPDGALWTIRPKGRAEITEAETMAGGQGAGLVDVKVAKFTETHTAEKFVIPVAQRAAHAARSS
jgi:hypothetical protein